MASNALPAISGAQPDAGRRQLLAETCENDPPPARTRALAHECRSPGRPAFRLAQGSRRNLSRVDRFHAAVMRPAKRFK